jgi:hypothetical protein
MFDDPSERLYAFRRPLLPGSEAAFRALIAGQSELALSDTTSLTVVRDDDLPHVRLEGAPHQQAFYATLKVYAVAQLKVRHSRKIAIVACAFMGDLRINLAGCAGATLSLDSCVVGGKLIITGLDDVVGSISLRHVRARSLVIEGVWTSGLTFNECAFAATALLDVTGGELRCLDSSLGHFHADSVAFETREMPAGQVDLDESLGLVTLGGLRQKIAQGAFDPFAYPLASDRDGEVAVTRSSDRKTLTRNDTIRFLMTHTAEQAISEKGTSLRYAEAKSRSHGLRRLFVVMTGGFLRPWIFVAWAALVVFVDMLAFNGVDMPFCTTRTLTHCNVPFFNAFFLPSPAHAGAGSSTRGAIAWHQVRSAAENGLGILLLSGFVSSLIRRYVD